VAIKAAYGGGGRGMKVVVDESEIEASIESAQRESLAYFGRDEIYMERYLTKPRHVEIQVLADSHGNCVYLGDRDCSAQRRHQKLIEEAPAPAIPDDIRKAMGEAAVAVARGCDYTNAGTVEFLYEDGAFFYLEMNTRLQVEHPVSELVTGVDLVEQQIRVAAGEELPFTQADVEIDGHAIEVRVNAEDPAGGAFMPTPGKITRLRVPDGFGTRFDTGYNAGDEISQFYDNLVGKLVVWGRTRDVAIARMLRALGEMEVEGVKTTIPADVAILEHPDFAAATHSTKWVEETLDLSGIGAPEPSADSSGDDAVDDEPKVRRNVDVEVNGKRFAVSVWVPESAGQASGPAKSAGKARPKRSADAGGSGAGAGTGEIAAPMQGTLVKLNVEVGDEVSAGDAVCVVEAMKMENNVAADVDGTVQEIRTAVGDAVAVGDIILVIA
jgi:acetyl-CoA/propionyl-CoA carboxylase biotin carboxyl carrier protein